MEQRRVVRASRSDWVVSACKALSVVSAVLFGSVASSEPPTEKSDNESVAAPAPTIDRVGFPKDYRTRFKVLGVIVKEEGLRSCHFLKVRSFSWNSVTHSEMRAIRCYETQMAQQKWRWSTSMS
jgi:hypothetical protein